MNNCYYPTVTDATSSEPTADADPVRDRLVDAAAEVFARDGYDGARIQDIVRTAGLTTGAVYGRFRGKGELLHEAVVTRAVPREPIEAVGKVADLVEATARSVEGDLSRRDALLLETYVAARREPEVADAISDANERWISATAPLVEAAMVDGTIDDGVDPEAVLFFVRVLRLGLLIQRGAGLPSPDPASWDALMHRIVASFGRPEETVASFGRPDETVASFGRPEETVASSPSTHPPTDRPDH
jgi:AcrR family transcriptional regulator